MRIGLLSDAHGNAFGLERCLQAMAGLSAGRLYFLGDAVGYLPGEQDVLALLKDSGIICQMGNHEAMLLGRLRPHPENEPIYRHSAAFERLGSAGLAAVSDWPASREVVLDGRRLLLVHGSPSNVLEGYCYPDSGLSEFEDLPYDAVFMGHTHRPFVRRAGNVLAVNVGSCGLPRDQGNALAFAVYDSQTNHAEIYRLLFDPAEVLQRYGDAVHDFVRRCFERRLPAGTAAGQFLSGWS
ncbi:MAG: metallophosphoesterase family protein [Bryobacteraceae bacterium]